MLIITVADSEWFTLKSKPITFTRAFVELYNKKICRQVHEIHEIIEFEKMYTLTLENLRSLGAYWIIEILLILYSAYIVSKD